MMKTYQELPPHGSVQITAEIASFNQNQDSDGDDEILRFHVDGAESKVVKINQMKLLSYGEPKVYCLGSGCYLSGSYGGNCYNTDDRIVRVSFSVAHLSSNLTLYIYGEHSQGYRWEKDKMWGLRSVKLVM
jgi:hypothetical protein